MNQAPIRYDSAKAIMAYIWNTSSHQFVSDLFPGTHPEYVEQKSRQWSRSPVVMISTLDEDNFRKLVDLAWARYYEAANREGGAPAAESQ